MQDDVDDLESRIDELTIAVERSRRLIWLGQAAAVIGVALLVLMMLGLLAFQPGVMIFAITCSLGGLVLTGSSATSTQQLEAELRKAVDARHAAIGALPLRNVGDKDGGRRLI